MTKSASERIDDIESKIDQIQRNDLPDLRERVKGVESFWKTLWQSFPWVGVIVTVALGCLGTGTIYTVIVNSIDKIVEEAVSSEAAAYTTRFVDLVGQAEAAKNEAQNQNEIIADIATKIAVLVAPTATPSISRAEQTVYTFFSLINRDEYLEAWVYLTEPFQESNYLRDYPSFKDFWDDAVEVTATVSPQSLSGNVAYILVEQTMTWSNGTSDDYLWEYVLVFDNNLQKWKIDRYGSPK